MFVEADRIRVLAGRNQPYDTIILPTGFRETFEGFMLERVMHAR
jgi:hypothetical protein